MPGKFYDEWSVGETVTHDLRRTVTETDNILITTLTHNPQPLHLDAEYASGTEFGRVVVNGIFTFGLMVGISVADTTLGTLIANLGYDKVVMPKPVFIGDTLRTGMFEADVRARVGTLGIEPMAEVGADFAAFIRRDFERSEQLLRLANFQPE